MLEHFISDYCVDLDRIYAAGCSNGGMFVYELANDPRSAVYLAGIATQGEWYDGQNEFFSVMGHLTILMSC